MGLGPLSPSQNAHGPGPKVQRSHEPMCPSAHGVSGLGPVLGPPSYLLIIPIVPIVPVVPMVVRCSYCAIVVVAPCRSSAALPDAAQEQVFGHSGTTTQNNIQKARM